MKKQTKMAFFLACLIAAMGFLSQAGQAKAIEKTFRVKPGGRLVVDSDMGSIEVRGGNSNQVEVRVIKRAGGWDSDQAEEALQKFQVDFSQHGDEVVVEGRFKDSWFKRYSGKLKIRFLISVPETFNVDLQTAGGSISVDDLNGEVRAKTSGGSLNFGSINGPVWGKTAGGSIRLKGSSGSVEVKTAGGSIDIGEVEGNVLAKTAGGSISIKQAKGNVIAATAGGSIDVEEVMGTIEASTSGGSVEARITRQPRGDCSLKTSGGGVTVYLARDIAVDLDARSNWGKVHCDFDIEASSNSQRKSVLRGKINGGGPKLFLRSSAGAVRIKEL